MVNPISPPIVTVNLSPTEFRKNYTNNIKCQIKSELQDKEWLFDDALGLIGKNSERMFLKKSFMNH